ncbi:MAG: amino acid permease [Candidatus Omnitrophica bacterium]|nr:amino acid permease [Candidatus Omnitrophota bacterium]
MLILRKKVERPRELKWFHAGAMLYGDWGTSKAYVLGIAFALSGHASWFFLGLMSILTAVVGICYMVICRCHPDGGGVYSSVKNRSQTIAVMGALLLVADYVVTASLSAVDAFHYFNFPHPEFWAMGAILAIGAINWVGPTKGGSIAAYIAVGASATAAILFLSTLPHLPHVDLKWPDGHLPHNWSVFVGIVLALSGVEAVANMTSIMEQPVEKTSKKAIWPVLLEVSILTFLLGIAMNAIPGLTGHAEDMLRALGNHYIGHWYGALISLVFGFLLLSAVNTAITDLVNIQFLLARDRELPPLFGKLNRYGMPGLALIVATGIPILVLIFEHDVVGLAALYAIGVVGAITLNLGATASDFKLSMKHWERGLLFIASVVLFLVELTICFQKHNALLFVVAILTGGFLLRYIAKMVVPVPVAVEVPSVNVLTVTEAKEIAPLYHSSFLVALRSLNPYLVDEAVLRCKALGEKAVYLNYVEETPPATELPTEVEPSPESVNFLAEAQKQFEQKGITAVPVWQFGDQPGKQIARAARELEVNTVMIGTTKRSALVSLLRGDVLRSLAANLPSGCHLIISG